MEQDLSFIWVRGVGRTVKANRMRGLEQIFMAGVQTQPIPEYSQAWTHLGYLVGRLSFCLLGSTEDPFQAHLPGKETDNQACLEFY